MLNENRTQRAPQSQRTSWMVKAYLEGHDHTTGQRPNIDSTSVDEHLTPIATGLKEYYGDELVLTDEEIRRLILLSNWMICTGRSIGFIDFDNLLNQYEELNKRYKF